MGTRADKDLITLVADGDLEFLGAAVGSAAHCAAHTQERVEKAQPLLDEIALLDDPQIALLPVGQTHTNAKAST